MASPAIHAMRMVTSVIDTQPATLSPDQRTDPGTVVGPSRRHRWWAVPMAALALVVLLVISVTSVLSASLTADKHVPSEADPAVEELQPTPYARVPAAAEPVDDRVSFGQLAGVVEVDQ